jgi:hypothetical protein
MNVEIEAKITLLLREKDINLFLKALRQFQPENEDEAHNRHYLLGVLEQLVLPE